MEEAPNNKKYLVLMLTSVRKNRSLHDNVGRRSAPRGDDLKPDLSPIRTGCTSLQLYYCFEYQQLSMSAH